MTYSLEYLTISSKNGDKNQYFWGKSAQKYFKIEVIYVIKILVGSKSIPK